MRTQFAIETRVSRQPRVFLPGLSLHVMKRGNNRGPIFQDDADYAVFLGLLRKAVRAHPIALHAYVLMTNHYHLLVTPGTSTGLPLLMKELNGAYTSYYNREYQRIGTIWSGRYRGIVIQDERYWLTCLRYIEQNPVRARLTRTAAEYRWSSYAAHADGRWTAWLQSHAIYEGLGPTPEERQKAYRCICESSLPADHLQFLR